MRLATARADGDSPIPTAEGIQARSEARVCCFEPRASQLFSGLREPPVRLGNRLLVQRASFFLPLKALSLPFCSSRFRNTLPSASGPSNALPPAARAAEYTLPSASACCGQVGSRRDAHSI